jgi:UDP-N-acetylglucosamine 2-epimerase (non-hydrolysing)
VRKVMTIVGTRPELIKMCRVIDLFDQQTRHVLVHTGQNYDYELNQVFFEELQIRKPDYFLEAAGPTPAATIARVIERADEILAAEAPDALLIYGDTNSCLAVIAAKRRKIPIFHMEAGNRCFDARVPEEINRKIVDHLSDINITITEHARRYLLAENLSPDRVFTLGSHLPEVFDTFQKNIDDSGVLDRLGLSADGYFLVSAHREENVDAPERLKQLLNSLNGLAEEYGLPVLVSTHPRTRVRLEAVNSTPLNPHLRFEKPFGLFDYVHLQQHAHCVLSDSGTITEESAILGFPAVTVRDTHERPEGMDDGVVIMCGLGRETVLDAVRLARAAVHAGVRAPRVAAYCQGDVSWKLLKLVHSYIPYVKERVWCQSPASSPQHGFPS